MAFTRPEHSATRQRDTSSGSGFAGDGQANRVSVRLCYGKSKVIRLTMKIMLHMVRDHGFVRRSVKFNMRHARLPKPAIFYRLIPNHNLLDESH